MEDFFKLHTLKYRKGREILKMNFIADDLQNAIDKGRKFCESRKYHFIFVDPFLYDIDAITIGTAAPPKSPTDLLKGT